MGRVCGGGVLIGTRCPVSPVIGFTVVVVVSMKRFMHPESKDNTSLNRELGDIHNPEFFVYGVTPDVIVIVFVKIKYYYLENPM